MNIFIENVTKYIEYYGVKKTFIIKQTGIEKNKFSRLLNDKQDIVLEDMQSISQALGKDLSFFMQHDIHLQTPDYKDSASIAFYMGIPDEQKTELANHVFDFLEHIDAILGVRKRMQNKALEVSEYGV